MIWKAQDLEWDLTRRCLVMGILNVTPDSFSDGGKFLDVAAALGQARSLLAQGADILDVGGESTRPGAEPVEAAEESARVVPVIEAVLSEFPRAVISIDTSKACVAEAALRAGARIINDITALHGDPAMARTASDSDAGLVLMHMQGRPRTMQSAPHYEDVVAEVTDFLRRALAQAVEAGVDPDRVAVDPGIGFGKTLDHNLQLLHRLDELAAVGRPVVLGVSRKSFIGRVLKSDHMENRHWPTVALTSHAIERGARIVRVHDVLPNVHAARMTEAILAAAR